MRGYRGEQHAVAEESGGDDEPGDVGGVLTRGTGNPSEQWCVVRRARSGTGGHLQEFKLGDRRHQRLGVAQQLVHAASRYLGRTVFTLGGPDHHRSVGAGDEVDRHAADEAADGGGEERPKMLGNAQAQNVAVNRAEREGQRGRQAVKQCGRNPIGHDHLIRHDRGAIAECHSRDARGRIPSVLMQQSDRVVPDGMVLRPFVIASARGDCRLQPFGQFSGVDLMIALDEERTGQLRAEERLECARLANSQRLYRKSIGQLHLAQVGKRLPVGSIRTDAQGPGRLVAGRIDIRSQGLHERGVERGGGEHQLEQVLFLVVQFAHRGKHSGCGIRCPGGGHGVDHSDAATRLGDGPGDSKSDDPATDHRNIHRAVSHDPASRGVQLLMLHACGNGL